MPAIGTSSKPMTETSSGTREARAAQVIERPERHEIVDAEDRLRRRPARQQPARGFLPARHSRSGRHATIVGVMPRAAAKSAKARSRASRLGLGFAMLITAKRAAPVARRASKACRAPPRSSQRTLSSSGFRPVDQDQRLAVAAGQLDEACRRRAGQEDGRLRPVAQQLPAGVGDVLGGRADADERRHVAALDQGARQRGDHLRPERRIGVGGHEPHELAAMGEQPAREIVDLVSEGSGRLLHPRQRRRRDAGAGRKGPRDGGSRDAGAFARHPARSRTAAGRCLCFRASAQPTSRLDHRSAKPFIIALHSFATTYDDAVNASRQRGRAR